MDNLNIFEKKKWLGIILVIIVILLIAKSAALGPLKYGSSSYYDDELLEWQLMESAEKEKDYCKTVSDIFLT